LLTTYWVLTGDSLKPLYGAKCAMLFKLFLDRCRQSYLDVAIRRGHIFLHFVFMYRVAQKSKPLPNDQKIVLKAVIEIRFSRQIKV